MITNASLLAFKGKMPQADERAIRLTLRWKHSEHVHWLFSFILAPEAILDVGPTWFVSRLEWPMEASSLLIY